MIQTHNYQWLVEAPPVRVLTRMASPMLAAIFLLFAYDVLESQLLSNISLEALTALGFSVPVTTAMSAFAIAMTITTNTTVTRVLSRDKAKTPEVIVNALILAVILSLIFATLAAALNTPIFRFLGIDYALLPDNFHLGPRPLLLPLVEHYMMWRYAGWVFLVLIWQVNSLLRSVGLIAHAGSLFICWMLSKITLLLVAFKIMDWAQAAPLETAALVYVGCDAVFALISIALLFYKLDLHRALPMKISPLATIKSMSIVGMPATVQQLLTPLSITLLTIMVVPYGTGIRRRAGHSIPLGNVAFCLSLWS